MITNNQLREQVRYDYSDELIDCLRRWYVHFPGREPTETLLLRELSPNSAKSRILEVMNSYVEIKGKSLLEIGFGTGQTLACAGQLGARKLAGIDINSNLLEMASLRCKEVGISANLFVGNACTYDFNDQYDLITCWQVLEHLDRRMQMPLIEKLYSLLNPQGVLFIQVPNRSSIIDAHDSNLPFAHWLPHSMGIRFANFFGRTPPNCNPMRYRDVLMAVKRLRGAEVLNKIDVCKDIKQLLQYRFRRPDLHSKLLALVVGTGYCLFRENIQHLLPNVNIFVKKSF